MMRQLYILLAIAMTVTLYSCTEHDFDELADDTPVEGTLQLCVGIDEMVSDISSEKTRAVENNLSTTFETGDEIGLIVKEGSTYKGNFKYVYDGSKWKTDGDVYLLPKETKTNTYIVYSPYITSVTSSTATVAKLKTLIKPVADQSTKEKYHACDLITATKSQSTTNNTVTVTLQHEYSVFMIDSHFTNEGVSWSKLVKKTGDSTYDDDATDAAVKVVVSGGTTVNYIPWLNNASGGDNFYRFVLPPTSTSSYDVRAKITWSQKYNSVYTDYAAETPIWYGYLYKCSD